MITSFHVVSKWASPTIQYRYSLLQAFIVLQQSATNRLIFSQVLQFKYQLLFRYTIYTPTI